VNVAVVVVWQIEKEEAGLGSPFWLLIEETTAEEQLQYTRRWVDAQFRLSACGEAAVKSSGPRWPTISNRGSRRKSRSGCWPCRTPFGRSTRRTCLASSASFRERLRCRPERPGARSSPSCGRPRGEAPPKRRATWSMRSNGPARERLASPDRSSTSSRLCNKKPCGSPCDWRERAEICEKCVDD